MENVVAVIGAGQIGQAIARRAGVGRHVLLADRSEAKATNLEFAMDREIRPVRKRTRRFAD